jgi:subtilisin family serine protease
MSLGTPAINSYEDDPICNAVRKLVDAGVVVVAAAGNNGKDANGQKIYGAIDCPGNEPSAITVGASNSFGTDPRNEDSVTTYSSRGPTRSFSVDSYGLVHFDNIIKPDLIAPGNKIIAAEAIGNGLLKRYSELETNKYSTTNMKLMYLSGTSMSTPTVAGAAALLLEAHSSLTPNMVKMLLMYTAQPLAGFNTLEQGAGQLNVAGAVTVARIVRTDLLGLLKPTFGSSLLTQSAPAPQTTISSFTFPWTQGSRTQARHHHRQRFNQ